jgi:hypothetical protein
MIRRGALALCLPVLVASSPSAAIDPQLLAPEAALCFDGPLPWSVASGGSQVLIASAPTDGVCRINNFGPSICGGGVDDGATAELVFIPANSSVNLEVPEGASVFVFDVVASPGGASGTYRWLP